MFLCSKNSPGKNTGVNSHTHLQGIFPTQGSNSGLPHCGQMLYRLSHQESFFLTCIQISQEAGKVVWYSHLFKNFPQFVVIHTVKGFSVVNKAEIGVFLNSVAFSVIQRMLAI